MQIKDSFLISAQHSGLRIDKFLCSQYSNIPRRIFQQEIKRENILLNKKPVKPSQKINFNDQININFPFREKVFQAQPDPRIKIKIIFENVDFLIINKPTGISVHPSKSEKAPSLISGILAIYPQLANIGEDQLRPAIVHRLDKETSGLLIIPKTQEAFTVFKSKFQQKTIQKTYLAICHKIPNFDKLHYQSFVGRSLSNPIKQVSVQDEKKTSNPKKAITNFKIIKTGNNFSLIQAQPQTGRKHQIRVQLLELGYSIVGDKKYYIGDQKQLNSKYPYHLLWATELKFNFKNKNYHFKLNQK